MPPRSEHKTTQARNLAYADAIGWTPVSHEETERCRWFDINAQAADRTRNSPLFLDDLLDANVREFNPRYPEAKGVLLGQFSHLQNDTYGNREFIAYLRNKGTVCDHEK